MTRSLRMLMFVVVATAAIVPASPALGRPTKVALTQITGDTAGLGRAVAGALLEGELEVIAGTQVTRAIDRLGLTRALGERDLAKLADELEVDAVVKGAFDRRGHRLRFTIFAGGKQGKPFTVQFRNADSDKFRQVVRATVEAKIALAVPKHRAQASESDGVADDDLPGNHKTKKADVADATEPGQPGKAAPASAADEPAGPGKAAPASAGNAPAAAGPRVATRDNDDPASSVYARAEPAAPAAPAAPATAHTANLAALRVDLGGSMAGRRLQFDTRAFDGAPRSYHNAPSPGARVGGELYPIAWFAPTSWLAGLGVAADYDKTLSLTLRASNELTVPLAVAEQHYAFGVRYRLAFGHRPTSPTLTLGAGYGARRFVVDRSGLQMQSSFDLPDVDYRMFDPGVAFRLPLGGHVAVTLAGQGLVVFSAGPIARTDQYGSARIIGGTASAGVELVITERLLIRVAAEATQLDLSFTGNGTLATSRDGDPSTVDVRGATDRYYGGAATVAVTY